jgi:hypothetical protein
MKLKVNLSLLVFLITMGLALLSCGTEANYPKVPIYEEEEELRSFKLIALGDSYTIGQNVCEDCRFPAQLKDSLQTYSSTNDSFSLEIIAQTG